MENTKEIVGEQDPQKDKSSMMGMDDNKVESSPKIIEHTVLPSMDQKINRHNTMKNSCLFLTAPLMENEDEDYSPILSVEGHAQCTVHY